MAHAQSLLGAASAGHGKSDKASKWETKNSE